MKKHSKRKFIFRRLLVSLVAYHHSLTFQVELAFYRYYGTNIMYYNLLQTGSYNAMSKRILEVVLSASLNTYMHSLSPYFFRYCRLLFHCEVWCCDVLWRFFVQFFFSNFAIIEHILHCVKTTVIVERKK